MLRTIVVVVLFSLAAPVHADSATDTPQPDTGDVGDSFVWADGPMKIFVDEKGNPIYRLIGWLRSYMVGES